MDGEERRFRGLGCRNCIGMVGCGKECFGEELGRSS